jgi:RNA polymerase sigma-70 factor (ECF subfamily)
MAYCLKVRVKKLGEASNPYEATTDEELARMVAAGQPEVFARLYARYYSRVYRMAYGMTGRHDAAEDLAQEVFIRAYQKINLFGGQSSFSTWFYRLAFNHALNYAKARRNLRAEDAGDLDRLPSTTSSRQMDKKLLQDEVQAQVHRALFSLKPRLRLVVILRDIEGLSYEEIAERMNCSTGTLASQLKRARQMLARKLEHLRGTF